MGLQLYFVGWIYVVECQDFDLRVLSWFVVKDTVIVIDYYWFQRLSGNIFLYQLNGLDLRKFERYNFWKNKMEGYIEFYLGC